MNSSYRQLALQGLLELLADNPLPPKFPDWPPAAKHLLLQTCRFYHQLESIAQHLMSKKPKDRLVWSVIILGLCELHILDKAEHAVINEMVSLVKKNKFQSASGFTNAILRKSIREKTKWQHELSLNDIYRFSHPQWLMKKIQSNWPEQWPMILHANNEHPPMTIRVNETQISRDDYMLRLADAQATLTSPQGIILEKASHIQELPGFQQGLISIQDEAAQLAALLLNVKKHHRILDACAAPGGKTSHILETSHPSTCIAIELQEKRFKKLQKTFERLNLHPSCLLADASQPSTWWDGHLFDRILIDAPCSGTGVIRRHPDIKIRRSEDNLYINLNIQQQLLENLWPLLKPNGLLLYATCSILPEENEQQIENFIKSRQDAIILPIDLPVGLQQRFGLQILPGMNNMDGFYYSLLRKSCHET